MRALIDIALYSLRHNPEDWKVDQFKATNSKLDVEVWIANSYYGLKIKGPGVSTSEEPATFTGWLTPWRRAVMKAVRAIGESEVRRRFAEFYPEGAARLGIRPDARTNGGGPDPRPVCNSNGGRG